MGLSIEQQGRAAKAYIIQQLRKSDDGSAVLKDRDFMQRFEENFMTIFGIFAELYGYRFDCLDQLAEVILVCCRSWKGRPDDLKQIDKQRELDPDWYLSSQMLGGVCYVDRYAQGLEGIKAKIPYFQELGLTYLHLMPLFLRPKPFSDGGYAVSSYREIEPELGTIEQLRDLATELRKVGISLVVDLIFNHTSNEHDWAKKAAKGDPEHSAMYWIFPDRSVPSAFEASTREIFPDDHPGSFIQLPDGRYIWSTFYRFQWDLNYSNPNVFRAMAGEMLYLANIGIDLFRMDAVAFMWKQINTDCENLPEVHKLLRAFNALCRLAAPSVLFKSEAIVHPDFVAQYIDRSECQLSYNPLQMALTWEALATRDASMLSQAIERRHNIARGCAWVNYVRSHDDIGWTFSDEDALELGKQGTNHRKFLNAFYVSRHPGSFARGVPFQDNPKTGDCRISGTTASLAGLESGQEGALDRILLAYSIAMSTGGIPLIYLGDEVGQLNDYSYMNDPAKMDDSRWVNRPPYPEQNYAERHDKNTIPGQLYAGMQHLIRLRKSTPELAGGRAVGFYTANPAVLGYQRPGPTSTVLCLVNFSDERQWVGRERLMQLPEEVMDLVSGYMIELRQAGIHMRSHQYMWLRY
ncbi:Amylosucrase [Endocarpon pusillum Z07020]|uniref:Amylosucrase n=1 Tax=Endocarpon pusillum (strain Z07020 / HMAS-L-300199) TaxID=1263415 RepID=U1HKP1_ENDPU|nr:Amylosucrase [Endocarpon pusillum Z07020]ERF70815.1 Amylosucrase [Endocarpon pusillum Z07020]